MKVETVIAKTDSCCDPREVNEVPRVKVETDIAETGARCECDPREAPSMKVENDIAKTDSCYDRREVNEVPRVKTVETDTAETDSCCVPRELPKVKVEIDIATAPIPPLSGCDTVVCYKSDPSHPSEVKIEIDVAEETPLSWTAEDPVQSKLVVCSFTHSSWFSITKLKLNVFFFLKQRKLFLLL